MEFLSFSTILFPTEQSSISISQLWNMHIVTWGGHPFEGTLHFYMHYIKTNLANLIPSVCSR